MASPELQRLWKLAQVDRLVHDIRSRAAALDVGQKLQQELKALEAAEAERSAEARQFGSELADLELAQKGIDDKLKKIDREMYGGKVVNSREVENLEKEIAGLKRQREKQDERILELWELVPPAKSRAEEAQKQVAAKRAQLEERRKKAAIEKQTLESEFKRLSASRPEIAKAVGNPTLLARYEGIRQRMHGIGMAQVTRQGSCSECGTMQPERTLQTLKDDKLATCDSCHRILYYTEGVV